MAVAAIAMGVSTTTCKPEDPEPTHGYVCVDLNRAPNADDSVFSATTTIRVKLHYAACLRDFYINQHPEYRKDGMLGEDVFLEAASTLCDPDAEDRSMALDCTIEGLESFDQIIRDTEQNEAYSLTIDYKLNNPGDAMEVIGRRLHFGPLPVEEAIDPMDEEEGPLIVCDPGDSPSVTIIQLADIQGLSGETPIWQAETFTNTPNKSRIGTEGGCIDVGINANG